MMDGAIVRALDVGYGNVKFVRRHEKMEDRVVCDMFPSMCLGASNSTIGSGALQRRETVVVDVEGTLYEVGHEITQAHGPNDISSIMNKEFVKSPGYMARVLGALHYMFIDIEGDCIDLLVVGLPVNNVKGNKDFLIDKLTGKHMLPGGREVQIKDVKVYEQPLGAFFNFMYSPDETNKYSYSTVKSQKTLIIDPGMFTFDWLLIDNMKATEARSGATNRAMSDVIKAIAKAVAEDIGEGDNESDVFKILDEAIRQGRTPRIVSKDINIDKYMDAAKSVVNESVEALATSVGKGLDIDNIMLVGGGARFFVDTIKDKYPKHQVITSTNTVYANVIGFQLSGERLFLRDQVRNRKNTLAS